MLLCSVVVMLPTRLGTEFNISNLKKRWNTDELRFPKSELNLNFNKPEKLSRMLLESFVYLSFQNIRFFTTNQREKRVEVQFNELWTRAIHCQGLSLSPVDSK